MRTQQTQVSGAGNQSPDQKGRTKNIAGLWPRPVCPCSDLSRPASISKERAHIPPYAIQKNPTATP
jgi:hypothetical protein